MLLGTILAIGNVLNDGTKNGQADGFDIDVVKLSKPSSIKDCNGKSLLAYTCKLIIEDHKTFPAEVRTLNKFIKDRMKMIDLKLPHTNLKSFYDQAFEAYKHILTEKLDESDTDDNFTKVVGSYFKLAATRMDIVETKTEEI